MVSGTEWLEFSDFIEQAVLGRQSYILQGYSPFLSVAFHLFYASQSHSKLSYPSSHYEVTYVTLIQLSARVTLLMTACYKSHSMACKITFKIEETSK